MSDPLHNNNLHVMSNEFYGIMHQLDKRLESIENGLNNQNSWFQTHDTEDNRRFDEMVQLLREQTDELRGEITGIKSLVQPVITEHDEKMKKQQNKQEDKRLIKSTLVEKMITVVLSITATLVGAWFLKDLK